ncbi:MAG: tetratricopeptide repeat protein [Muribaculaceae bacterium]|nr:tetratricopeptide repeat protein [Muribaculaceae bacterium]
MNRKLCFIAVLGASVALSSCSKKLGQFQSDYFSVNPNPLEVVGDKVPATVTGRVPQKFFKKNAEVTVTPYLVFNGTEVASQAYSFQGEKVRGNNPVISYDNGGTVTIPVSYLYQPEMNSSVLELAFTVNQGSKQYVLPRVQVATGVIPTAAFATAKTVTPAIAPDAFQRIINEKYSADIMFLINVANIRAGQLKTNAMDELRKEILATAGNPSLELKEININSYASPDGPEAFNYQLAEKREKNTVNYVEGVLKKDKITEFGELTKNFTAEDWEGFKELVSKSNIQDKDLILSVLSMYKDPQQRERELRNLAAVFEVLADQILPQLRYSRITASIDVIGKSDKEIQDLFKSNPKELSVEEILYCATLTDNLNDRMKIYETATRIYPNDYRTWNNLGVTQYEAGDYNAAKANFQKALSLNAKSADAKMNLGLISILDKDYAKANEYFGQAAGADGLNNALGVYYLKMGDNASAVRAFGDSKTNNAALAQILTKDYSKAKATLAAIAKPDATTYYLKAVLAARTNNEADVKANLAKSISLDKTMSDRAANDLEFANFNIK